MFRYRLVTGLLVLGVFFGFGSGIASVVHHARGGGGCHSSWRDRREEHLAQLERRFARACVDAARTGAPGPAPHAATAPTPGPSAGYYAAPQWGPPPGWAYGAPWAVAPGYALAPPGTFAPGFALAPPAPPAAFAPAPAPIGAPPAPALP
jgi:hypothetical protein